MTKTMSLNPEEIVAQALNYLVAHEPMLLRFFNLTGLSADTIREAAESPRFSAFVLDHFLADEILLAQFTQSAGIRPEDVRLARQRLDRSVEAQEIGPSARGACSAEVNIETPDSK
jgi:hypothetical protein